MTNLLIYGVDGMSKKVVDMMMADDELPNIKKLKERETTVDGECKSYVSENSQLNVPRTGPMWNSIYTGLKPKEHGYTLDGWREGEAKFHKTYTVWDKLSEEEIKIALFGMPMTYRAKEINGWMMSGFVATTLMSMFDNMLYPSDLIEDNSFIENTATYMAKVTFDGIAPQVDRETGTRKPMERAKEFYEKMREAENNKVEKFKELYEENEEVDVAAFGTTFADKIGHADSINPIRDLTRKTYKDVDRMLGELIEITDPDHVVIISDHGFGGWTHDLYGYYLNTTGEELEEVFDFTPFLLEQFDLDYEPEAYGIKEESGEDVTEKEKEEARNALAKMGYDVN